MANPRGRPSNAERERRAAEAASAAQQAIQQEAAKPELPLETTEPIDQGEPEERSHLVRVAPRNEVRRQANEALAEVRKLRDVPRETSKEAPDEAMKKDLEILRWGTPEDATAALKRILSSQAKPTDENRIVEMAADKMRHDDAVKSFDREFKDIGASPMHLKLVIDLRNEALQQ